jgi:hypothetical protein
VIAPDGARTSVRAVLRGGETAVDTGATAKAGFYELQAGAEGAALTVAANVDTGESDAKVLGAGEWAAAFAGLPVRALAGDESVAAAVAKDRIGNELWPVLAAAAVALLTVEAFLARWYTRRGGGD